jgi:hypothetical protein
LFTPQERESVRERLLEHARSDPRIAAAAVIGSAVTGTEDRWSDVDLTFGVTEPVADVLAEWGGWMERELGALHWWDLPWGSTTYRVFLRASCLQVDLSFTPAEEFGARGPAWRTVFGETVEQPHSPPPNPRGLIGMGWLCVKDTRIAIERGRLWQAEYFVSLARDQALALACVRLGEKASYGRGLHRLPPQLTGPFEEGLVRSLDPPELQRALRAVRDGFLREVREVDAELADRLEAPLAELAGR